nr:hypothetical protein [uncultured Agathobaculum sp.]
MKEWLEQEKQKLKQLTRKQKLWYLWDYYRLWIIGGVSLLLVVGFLIGNYIRANRENYIYTLYVNTFAEIGQGSDFWQGYVDFCGVDTSQENVIFDAQNYFDMSSGSVTGNHYYEKAVVLIDSGTVDAIVMETENLALLGQSGRLIDLQDDRTQALAEQYADRLITVTHTDEAGNTREIPVGIDISDSKLVSQAQAYEDCALGISAGAQHIEAVGQFLDYILQGV